MSRFDVTVLHSVAQLESLASEWVLLSEPFATPLLDHDWFACAGAALHSERDLRVVTVREHGRLVAVAPMAMDGARHLVLLGSSVLHEPSACLFASEDALRHLIRTLVEVGHVIVLDRTPAGLMSPAVLPTRMQSLTVRKQTAESLVVAKTLPWEQYCASLSTRMKKKLAEAHAKSERDYGSVQFTRTAPTPDQTDKALSLLVEVEAGGWKARQGSALSTRPELLGFFRLYARRAAASGRLRLCVLRIGEVTAAVELGVEAYGRMWSLKVAYDERLAAVVPGVQMTHASIGAAFAAGLNAYEFLGSAEPWQERWHPQRRGYQLTAIYPLRPGAMITALHDVTTHFSRRFQRTVQDQEVEA